MTWEKPLVALLLSGAISSKTGKCSTEREEIMGVRPANFYGILGYSALFFVKVSVVGFKKGRQEKWLENSIDFSNP